MALQGKTALVTGASRGVGRGIALGLGEAGATVYVTGRTVNKDSAVEGLSGTIMKTAEEVDALGGRGIPAACNHRDDAAVGGLAADQRVLTKSGRVLTSVGLAEEYGFTDIDGKQPQSLSLDEG